ncbi:IFT139 / intraflagellar transport protein 139 [Leishmania donovani]|uniref:Tyrosine_phosphatase_putative/GeneDB:LmjF.04.0560 n=1 Tax=Leishmania donovani TaxID=5661 RepID=A0A6J8F321_LEIDO|nr:IFT139 / intraflagellar transport protein 139 [Leishmania donovani]VDZ41803.1 tyrosine_phosphatase_putative/GeneDB:LmjF.04.0560 [Leishmania donovani]
MTATILRTNYALLLFYVREKYWHHAEEVCMSVIQSTDDHMFRVWRALTLDRQGMTNDAIREYKTVESRRATAVPALMGMQLIYRNNRDQEGVAQTEAKLDGFEVADNMGGWVQAAALCWAAGDINAARDILLKFTDNEAAMAYRDEYTNYGTIRGWVDLLSGRGALLEKAGALFSSMLEMEEAQYSFFQSSNEAGGGGSGTTKWTDMNAALGYVAFLEHKTQLMKAQSLLDRLVVLYPNCSIPPLVGKARLLMQADDWEQAIEVTHRILAHDKGNVEALALEALYAIGKDTRQDAAQVRLRRLLDAVRAKEPRNVALLHQFALVFSRLAGGRLDLLNITTQFSEMAYALDSRNGDVLCGLGYQQLYRHDYKTAVATFRKAATLTDSLGPLLGTVTCLLHQGDVEEAAAQLQFCNQLQPAAQRNAELSMLNAQLRWRLRGMEEETAVLRYLDQAAEAIKQDVKERAGSGMEVYVHLNAPVALVIAHAYLMHCRNEPPDPMFKHTDVVSEKCGRHLEFVVQHLPACMEAQLMLAKVWFVRGDVRKAQNLLKNTLLMQEQPLPDAFLLSSHICQYMGDVKLASQALERALTLDFSLQEQPLYNLLLGTVQGTTGKYAEALASLQRAYSTVKSAAAASSAGKPTNLLSVPETVTLYLQLAQAQLRVRDVEAARATLAEAALQFRDSAQIGRVVIAQAMLAARTDVDKGIELLRQVPSKSEFYTAAHSQLGKLFLTQKHNLGMYIQCFQEMAEAVPSAQSYVALGEAYTVIQEPEQAIAAYEKARALSPSSSELSVRVGRALVAAHDYAKAIRYYQDALMSDPHLSIVRADLATLQWRLGRIDAARETIVMSPVYELPSTNGAGAGVASAAAAGSAETVGTAIERINLYLLLYKVLRDQPWTVPLSEQGTAHTGSDGDHGDAALRALLTARSLQRRLIEQQLRAETAEVNAEQRVVMSGICTELGARCIYSTPAPPPSSVIMTDKKVEAAAALALQSAIAARLTNAREYLREAITYDESNECAQLESAQLCYRTGDMDGCERHCTTVLRMADGSSSNADAVILLANLYTQQGRTEDARDMFDDLLRKTPQHYEALVYYLILLYHAGQLTEAKDALGRAAAAVPAGQRADPGLSYARGLYEHLCNNNAEALRHFNLARLPTDNAWCTRALVRMIRIYLVPTTQDLWVRGANPAAAGLPLTEQQHQKSAPQSKGPAAAASTGGTELHDNIRYAEQLLLLLPVHSEERRILQAYCTMATRRPEELETALHLFLECIVAAETGGVSGARAACGATTAEKKGRSGSDKDATKAGKKPRRVGDSDSDDDEDLQLLASMHEAAAELAQRSSGSSTATLAFALQCKVVHPEAFLGLAISLFVSGQETAARNVLARLLESKKVMAKMPVTKQADKSKGDAAEPPAPITVSPPIAILTCSEDDTIERAMLLQAYMDTQEGQLENARFVLQQVLAANQGCGSAWNALGMIYERNQKHKDASRCYQKAWELVQESDPAVGYKLGFNYLRGGEPVKAIDVCKRVLAHHATYPHIEADVMDVAYSMLRP